MLFALPDYQFPYIVLNRCLYLTSILAWVCSIMLWDVWLQINREEITKNLHTFNWGTAACLPEQKSNTPILPSFLSSTSYSLSSFSSLSVFMWGWGWVGAPIMSFVMSFEQTPAAMHFHLIVFAREAGPVCRWREILTQNLGPLHTRETESPWLLHFKHSHWWKRRSPCKFAASHYTWGSNGVCECKMDVKSTGMDSYMASKWIMFHGHLDYPQKPLLGGRPNTKPLGDHGTPNTCNCWFIFNFVVCENPHE
jgi:hypothetical protein